MISRYRCYFFTFAFLLTILQGFAEMKDTHCICLPVAQTGNRMLVDDGNGWLNLGCNRDMRLFSPGRYVNCGIPFEIGDKAIVLKGATRLNFPERSEEFFLDDRHVERFAFCHADACWSIHASVPATGTVVFSYCVTYSDGTSELIPIRHNFEVADWLNEWWNLPPDNGERRTVWQSAIGESQLDVYHSQWKNPHPEKTVKSIRVQCGESLDVVPIVFAITAVCDDGTMTADDACRLDETFREYQTKLPLIADTSDWFECRLDWNNQAGGSILDMSRLNHKPAGKFGFVCVGENGRFEFEKNPGMPIRFWGTNIAFEGCFPPKDMAPFIARSLASQGCNMVRYHLFGRHFPRDPRKELFQPGGVFSEFAIDRMEYFTYCLKQEGIYIYMDLNDGFIWDRITQDMEEIPDFYDHQDPRSESNTPYMYYSLFCRRLIDATKHFACCVYLHKNPYTGLTMVDDPVYACFEITNENNTTFLFPHMGKRDFDSPFMEDLYTEYAAYRKRKGLPPSQNVRGECTDFAFNVDLETRYYEEMRRFLIDELGVRVPVNGTNFNLRPADMWSQKNMDFMSAHYYIGAHKSVVLNDASPENTFLVFPSIARYKIAGKPLVISEWNFNYPSNYRSEGYPLMAAIASYQGWDSLLTYCAAGSSDFGRWEDKEEKKDISSGKYIAMRGIFSNTQIFDPSTWGVTRTVAPAFRLGYFAESKNLASFTINRNDMMRQFDPGRIYPVLTGLTRVETCFSENEETSSDLKNFVSTGAMTKRIVEKTGAIVEPGCTISDTGELRRFSNPGLFVGDSPKCQMLVGDFRSVGRENSDLRRSVSAFTITSSEPFASLSIVSLDDVVLANSSQMLLCLVGNSRNQGEAYGENGKPVNFPNGRGPVVTQPLAIRLAASDNARPITGVYAIDSLTGKRMKQIPPNSDGFFDIRTGDCRTIYFELVRQ